ncbi:MAG: DUF3969 family protein [Thermoactinomyces sp.]
MELKILVEGKEEIQHFLSIVQLGILEALEEKIMTIEEAEGYLFNPYSVEKLEELGIDQRVIDIVSHGCELEDVQSLIPDKLFTTIKKLKEETSRNLQVLPKPSLPVNKLIKNN